MRSARGSAVLMLTIAFCWLMSLPAIASEQSNAVSADSVTPLMQQMAGAWNVQAKMWPAAGAQPVELPPAHAQRQIVNAAYLREVMEAAQGSEQPAFTRTAYFSFNTVGQQYEYFSLDSRLPQMMTYAMPGANKIRGSTIELAGSTFIAPSWGSKQNVPFTYRLTVGEVKNDRQIVRLYLTELDGRGEEFVAFEYIYTRER